MLPLFSSVTSCPGAALHASVPLQGLLPCCSSSTAHTPTSHLCPFTTLSTYIIHLHVTVMTAGHARHKDTPSVRRCPLGSSNSSGKHHRIRGSMPSSTLCCPSKGDRVVTSSSASSSSNSGSTLCSSRGHSSSWHSAPSKHNSSRLFNPISSLGSSSSSSGSNDLCGAT